MADSPEQLRTDLAGAADAARDLGTKIGDLTKSYFQYIKSQKVELDQLNKQKKGLIDVIKAIRDTNKEAKNRIKTIVDLTKVQNKQYEAEEKLRRIIQYSSNGVKGYAQAMGDLSSTMKQTLSSTMGLVSAFGIQAVSWNGIVKTSLAYNKTLFELSRSQNVTGKGFKDLAATLQYVKTNTNMSQMQFLELSNTMLKGFVGVKPSLKEVAELMKVWGDQMGQDYESAKILFDMQAQFPPLFKKMAEGLQTIAQINSSGSATKVQQENLRVVKDQVIAFSLLNGISSDYMDKAIQALTPLTAQEREYNELLKQRAELSKTAADLELEFAKTFEPLQKEMLKTATAIIGVMTEYKEVTMGIAAAAVAMGVLSQGIMVATTLAAAFGTTMAAASGGMTLVAAALLAGGIGLSKWLMDSRDAEESTKKLAINTQLQASMEKEVAGLTGIRLEEYKKLEAAGRQEGETLEQRAKRHADIYKQVSGENAETMILAKRYQEMAKTVAGYQQALDASTGSLKETVNIAEEFGGTSRSTLDTLIAMSEIDFATSIKSFNEAMKMTKKMLGGAGIDIDITGGFDEIGPQLQDALVQAKEIKGNDELRLAIISQISLAMKEQLALTSKQGAISRATFTAAESNLRQQEKATAAYEARLDAERRLMESAQFGLGASVDMMKKQVELAYKLMQTYADTDKELQQTLTVKHNLREEDMKAIQNAGTQAEAEDYIKNVMGARGEKANDLNNYAVKHQEYTKKTMDQQQKIYDLTKDIREGYLDAIREMSTGAGEFEKIIGTQEMGVTQLMDSVKDTTGMLKLNTMALGGRQTAAQTTAGVGTQVAGQYTASGLSFIGGAQQEARNERIYKYGQFKKETEAVMRGEMPGRRSTIGTANVPGAENYLGPEREEQVLYNGVYDGVTDAFASRNFTRAMSVNTGVVNRGGNVPGREDSSRIQAFAPNVNALTRGYMGGRPSPEPSSGGWVPFVPGNKLRTPASRVDARKTWEAVESKKDQAAADLFNGKEPTYGEMTEEEREKLAVMARQYDTSVEEEELKRYESSSVKTRADLETGGVELYHEGGGDRVPGEAWENRPGLRMTFADMGQDTLSRDQRDARQNLNRGALAKQARLEQRRDALKKTIAEKKQSFEDAQRGIYTGVRQRIYDDTRTTQMAENLAVEKEDPYVKAVDKTGVFLGGKRQSYEPPDWALSTPRITGGLAGAAVDPTERQKRIRGLADRYTGAIGSATGVAAATKATKEGLVGGDPVWAKSSGAFKEEQEARRVAISRAGLKSPQADWAKSATVQSRTGKAYTSEAQRLGEETTGEMQGAYVRASGQREMMYGASEPGGGGSAVIRVILSPELRGQVESAAGVAVEVEQGATA